MIEGTQAGKIYTEEIHTEEIHSEGIRSNEIHSEEIHSGESRSEAIHLEGTHAGEIPIEGSGAGEGNPEEISGREETAGDNAEDGAVLGLLDERIRRALEDMGFEKLTPIQIQAIPALLQGKDIIGQAQTGTGKTAAFGIPLIQRVDPEKQKLQAIVLCPTRELAIQAALELRKLAKYIPGLKILPIYGGQDITRQIRALPGVQIIVGTPGRVMDHMRRHTIKLADVSMVILDEADEMLDMGFREDMELILGEIPGEHQTALFSATMPKPILEITGKFQKDADMIRVASKELTIPLVSQKYFLIKNQDKDAATIRLLRYYQPKLCLIFCNTKAKVDELTEVLKKEDFQAEGLHGDLIQKQRDVVMGRFRNGSTNILIATDVAARGIDVDNVEIVINYDVPLDVEYYVHRIGRTGRAGKTGQSFTFVNAREVYRIREIERFCRTTVEEKRLPSTGKVLKAKAKTYLDQAWELHEHEDIELMKKFLQRKMEEEECDALELAAAMLKYQVGDRGQEIEADEYVPPRKFGRRDERGRGGRGNDRRGREEGRKTRGDDRRDRGGRRYGAEEKDGERAGRKERRFFPERNKDRDGRRNSLAEDRDVWQEDRKNRTKDRRDRRDPDGERRGRGEERGARRNGKQNVRVPQEYGNQRRKDPKREDECGFEDISYALPKRKKKKEK